MGHDDEDAIELLPVHVTPTTSPVYNSGVDALDNSNHRMSPHHLHSPSHHNPQHSFGINTQNANDSYKPSNSGALLTVDKPAFYLLVLLYFLQGIPVGLAFGSIPFLMKSSHLSYSQLGTFSLASYPYSLKLFWSPFVDSFYSKKIGRRRSWIIPVQSLTGLVFIILGFRIDTYFADLSKNLNTLTFCFFVLVLMASTQDIAVDSWALVILSPASKSYASTAQTVGLNTGYFLSFTVFLAFNSKEFMNKYFRSTANQKDVGLISLGQYMVLSGIIFLACTAFVALKVPEVPAHLQSQQKRLEDDGLAFGQEDDDDPFNRSSGWENLRKTYSKMYRVLSLYPVQQFIIILLICKFGFLINEGATNLKLLDRGFSKEDLSLTVLIDFPFEIIFGYYVAKWSRGNSALNPWLYGYVGRLVAALLGQIVVYIFPQRPDPTTGQLVSTVTSWYFLLVIIQHLFSSLMSTIQFVSLSAFHTRIADPTIGGTYMTTLNTLSNFGGTWPKFFLLKFIDRMTFAICAPEALTSNDASVASFEKFWTNVKEFLSLTASTLESQTYFPTTPSLEQLSLFSSYSASKFDISKFLTYLSTTFSTSITSVAALSASTSSSIAAYSRYTTTEKIDFWSNSGQSSNLPTCATDPTKQVCVGIFGGECMVVKDGYYVMNILCVLVGTGLLVGHIWRKIGELQSLGEASWRVK
ncbi:hypothetical protein DASC09_051340 [Saccharomycopsis crataegensis]|uniref:Acetyl-CoA transporter n=1 Tax=Saccharomycopsis crataegensis TaxID=43959 RepID=A0AAV5QSV4_9ASCO|nr:hypothetical protein DASC09_051340 [Saccharomycopsis crataegensis]